MAVYLRPQLSGMPGGTTLRVELLAERRGSELLTEVTAEAETVRCRVRRDGAEVLERRFNAARRTDADLLAEAIERSGIDPISSQTVRVASDLVRPHIDEGAADDAAG